MKHIIKISILFTLITFTTMWETMSAGRSSQSCCTITVPGLAVFAQEPVTSSQVIPPEKDRSAESSNVLYQVMAVILVIWLGLAVYLFLIDRKVARLEKSMPEKPENKA